MKNVMKRFLMDDRGLETVEYAIIAALITLAAIATIGFVGLAVNKKFDDLLQALGGAPAAG